MAKHKELSSLRNKYVAEIATLAEDIASLTRVIRLFDPEAVPHPMKGTVSKPRIKRGALKRFVLDTFREASEPLTSKVLAHAWAKQNAIELTEASYPSLRQQITSYIKDCVRQDLIEASGRQNDPENFGSYKLYRKKEGG